MNNYQHPAIENEGLQPYVSTLEAEQELYAYELENSRPAIEGFPTLPKQNPINLSPDFIEFFDNQETQYRQEFYKQQERPISSIHTRLCELKDKLNSRQAALKFQLRQVEEQIETVNQQLDKLSSGSSN